MALYCSPDYQINWPFGSGEECKIDFEDSGHNGNLVSDQNDFRTFLPTSHPDASYQARSQLPTGSGEAINRFSRWWPSLFSNIRIFSYFYLLVTPMRPIKFQDNWPFISGEKAKSNKMVAILDLALE